MYVSCDLVFSVGSFLPDRQLFGRDCLLLRVCVFVKYLPRVPALKIFFTLPTLFWGSRCVTRFAAWHRHILVLCSTRIRRAAIIFMDIPHLNLPCMRCVRSALKAIEEGDTMPLRIRCRFEQASSFKCAQCIKRKDTGCITVRIDADVGGPID